jgi:hypothetical protein
MIEDEAAISCDRRDYQIVSKSPFTSDKIADVRSTRPCRYQPGAAPWVFV